MARFTLHPGAPINIIMLSVKCLLMSAVLGAILAMVAIPSRADTCRSQFVVMVRVLPHCQWSLQQEADSRARLAIACTRDTGYALSLARAGDPLSQIHTSELSGVGSGSLQILPLARPAADPPDGRAQSTAPLFLTINY